MNDDPAISTRELRVLLVADVRSPTTWGWANAVRSAGVQVFGPDGHPWPDSPRYGYRRQSAGMKEWARSSAIATPGRLRFSQGVRRLVGPALASIRGRRLRAVVGSVRPDVVHALRIPYEAMTAVAACRTGVPLAVSIWGNDLTLHASRSRITGSATRRVLARADLLIADCQRDIELAEKWGLRSATPTAVLPGGGGVDLTRNRTREPASNVEAGWTRNIGSPTGREPSGLS